MNEGDVLAHSIIMSDDTKKTIEKINLLLNFIEVNVHKNFTTLNFVNRIITICLTNLVYKKITILES